MTFVVPEICLSQSSSFGVRALNSSIIKEHCAPSRSASVIHSTLALLYFLVFLLADVAVPWDYHMYHNCGLLFLVNQHCVWLVANQICLSGSPSGP